jgi:cation-transporting ATPase 13A1
LRKKWSIPDPATGKPGKPTISEMLEQVSSQLDEEEVPTIKFGDASVAAPFTSKISSVKSVVNIIRQGRATLVGLTQMYKILALNSLILAYSLSVLHIAGTWLIARLSLGIKQGDWQATVAGLLITVCFFGLSKANAVEKLAPVRPQANIFNAYIILSVLGQSAIHMGSLFYIQRESTFYSEAS